MWYVGVDFVPRKGWCYKTPFYVRVILLSIFNGLRMEKAHGDYALTHEKAV